MMVGSIEAALGGAFAGKCRSDQHQGGSGDPCILYLVSDVSQGAAD
jgi:hypothetical protein